MKKKVAAILAAAAVFVSAMPLSAAAADTTTPYVESDTTMNFLVEQGKTYTFKMTVHGTHANPNIVMGNGAAFQTREVRKVTENGNDVYYFKVLATGEEGQAAGIYTTLPGQPSVKHAVAAIPYVGPVMGMNFSSYQVGKDIPAGEYVITPICTEDFDTGYFEVYNEDGSLCNNPFIEGEHARYYMTLIDGQIIKLDSVRMVSIQNSVRALPDADGNFISESIDYGTMYKCGYDFAPGTYTIERPSNVEYPDTSFYDSYVAIYNSSNIQKFVEPDFSVSFSSGTQQVTLKEGQYLLLRRAYVHLA